MSCGVKNSNEAEDFSQTRKLAILLDVAKALASQVRLDDLLATIISKTAEVLDAERATLFLYDRARDELWSKTADHLEIEEIRFSGRCGYCRDVARTRTVENIVDAYADPRFNPDFDKQTGYRTRSVLSMPLDRQCDELVGVIQVLNKKNATGSIKKTNRCSGPHCPYLGRHRAGAT